MIKTNITEKFKKSSSVHHNGGHNVDRVTGVSACPWCTVCMSLINSNFYSLYCNSKLHIKIDSLFIDSSEIPNIITSMRVIK